MRQQTAALWDGRLASEDCGDVRIGINDAEAREAKEAVRKVACPLFLSWKFRMFLFPPLRRAAAVSRDGSGHDRRGL